MNSTSFLCGYKLQKLTESLNLIEWVKKLRFLCFVLDQHVELEFVYCSTQYPRLSFYPTGDRTHDHAKYSLAKQTGCNQERIIQILSKLDTRQRTKQTNKNTSNIEFNFSFDAGKKTSLKISKGVKL